MRPTRTAVLLTAGLVTLLGIPAATAADAPDSLYVNNQDGSNCSDSGPGSQAVPFCTISAAAKVVQPGQTVRIKPGKSYDEAVTIDRSGEPGKPIGFVVDAEGLPLRVGLRSGRGMTISGASHVVVRGITVAAPLQVGRSSDVELDRILAGAGRDVAGGNGVVVGEGSADVRITRSALQGVRIDGGSRNTVLARNLISGISASALSITDAPGSVVTNNTLRGLCSATLALGGNSTGSAAFNNVLVTSARSSYCTSDGARNPFLVAQSATAGTRADYNLVAGNAGPEPAYSWSGTPYKDPAAFQAGAGQGAHDILTPSSEGGGTMDGSPTIDSADPTAPGVLPTDFSGYPTADDPRVPNTGRNGGYLDRGAYETQDGLSSATMSIDQSWAPVGTKVEVKASSDSKWPSTMSYRVDFGDGTQPVVTQQGNEPQALASHVYGKPGDYVVKVTAVSGVGRTATTEKPATVTAADKPLAADFTASPVLPTSDSPDEHVAPLTMGLDLKSTVAPWPVQSMLVDFGDGEGSGFESRDYNSPGQHTYSAPGEYKVTVKLQDIKGATSTVGKTVRVEYPASGYVATEPFRIVDTRTDLWSLRGGEPWSTRLPAGGSLSGGMTAAVLNVTVTGASEDTHLSVSPNRQDRPATSNVNVRAGGTSSNTVTVPVGSDGSVWFRLNSGEAKLIVDFVGYYQPNIGQRFSPVTPTRLADTRTGTAGALAGGQTRTVKVAGVGGIPADATAVALNLTGTGATSDTHVIAYPDPAKRPVTSNLNPEPGKDKSNQAIVPVGPNGTITLYNNAGSTHLVVDAVGYYGKDGKALFTPIVPKRLGDTRTTGKLAPGATTTVAGLPAGAVGAVLNVTATETSAAGFLTVHGYGSARTDASSLNTLPGLTVPNHVTTPVGDGKVSVFNSWGGSNHVITDLLGYFTESR
ncbi:PKD domain-containing protein [Streptomyces sp. NPDC059761]|uniref:PKD domain-containing protein n=1 Tax=Streptomyces sp. NPDC059761 TaxID=3346937 RepID=UPI003653F196